LAIIPEFVYRKVLMSGKWDYDRTIIVGPRTRDGTAGYHIIVPLIRPNGTTVLVDRGFVSKDGFGKFSKVARTNEEVFIQGMLRVSQVRNAFTPDNHPEKGEWYWIDVDAMAEHVGGEKANVQPVLVDEIFGTCPIWCTVAWSMTRTQRGMQEKPPSD
jgi:surfeit locus 1 family protein